MGRKQNEDQTKKKPPVAEGRLASAAGGFIFLQYNSYFANFFTARLNSAGQPMEMNSNVSR